MTISFRPAIRQNVNLLIGLAGGTGCGKTFSAMRMAKGIVGEKRFAVIDTERGRASHYADQFEFDVCEINAPFRPESYAEAILMADNAGYPVIVVDSMSHVWAGDGGVLDWQEDELDRMAGDDWKKREAVKMAAWIKPKLAHKQMVQKLLQVKAHLILCFRAEPKIEMVKDPDTKKTQIIAKQSLTGLDGWIPVCEKNLPFELTVSFLMTADKPGFPKPIKLQSQHKELFPLDQPINENSGELVSKWANGAKPEVQEISHMEKILQNAIFAAGFQIADVLAAWKKKSLADVTDQDAALAWIKKASEKQNKKSFTLDSFTKLCQSSTDIDTLKIHGELIHELPESEREAGAEILDYQLSILNGK